MSPPVTSVRPTGDAAGTVLIVHGLAEHRGRYAYVQRKLADAGYSSHAIDLRGHGEAEGFPGKVGSPDEFLDDVADGVTLASADDIPLFIVAHSMGTLPTVAYLGERGQDGIRGVVLSACPLSPGELQLAALANPEGPGVPPEAVSRDPEVVRAYVEDPLVFNDNVPPECTAAVLLSAQRAYAAAESVTLPVLLVHGGADPIALPAGSEEIRDALASEDKRLIVYEGLYHEVFNEPERDRVLGDVTGWLDAHR